MTDLSTQTSEPASPRRGLSWRAPDQARHQRALNRIGKYSLLVKVLRVLLPVLAVAAIAALFLWPQFQGDRSIVSSAPNVRGGSSEAGSGLPGLTAPPETDLRSPVRASNGEANSGVARMAGTRYTGRDAEGRPFAIEAASAERREAGSGMQDSTRLGSQEVIDLRQPSADIELRPDPDGRWLALRADRGRYDDAAAQLALAGNVVLLNEAGTRMVTETLHADLRGMLLWSDSDVAVTGPDIRIEAQGFSLDRNADLVVFGGPARLVLRGGVQ